MFGKGLPQTTAMPLGMATWGSEGRAAFGTPAHKRTHACMQHQSSFRPTRALPACPTPPLSPAHPAGMRGTRSGPGPCITLGAPGQVRRRRGRLEEVRGPRRQRRAAQRRRERAPRSSSPQKYYRRNTLHNVVEDMVFHQTCYTTGMYVRTTHAPDMQDVLASRVALVLFEVVPVPVHKPSDSSLSLRFGIHRRTLTLLAG